MELAVGEANLPQERLFTGIIRDLTECQERERRFNELQAELIHVSRLNELGLMVSSLSDEVTRSLTAMTNYISGEAPVRRRTWLARSKRWTGPANKLIVRVRLFSASSITAEGRAERKVENLPKTIREA